MSALLEGSERVCVCVWQPPLPHCFIPSLLLVSLFSSFLCFFLALLLHVIICADFCSPSVLLHLSAVCLHPSVHPSLLPLPSLLPPPVSLIRFMLTRTQSWLVANFTSSSLQFKPLFSADWRYCDIVCVCVCVWLLLVALTVLRWSVGNVMLYGFLTVVILQVWVLTCCCCCLFFNFKF